MSLNLNVGILCLVQVDRPLLSAIDWNLSIKNSSKADDGLYECQVNTEPKINYKIFLSVSGILQIKNAVRQSLI